MKKTKTAKLSKTKPSKEQLAEAARRIIGVALAGAILESVSEFLATGRAASPLKAVIENAERRLQEQAWRKQIEGML